MTEDSWSKKFSSIIASSGHFTFTGGEVRLRHMTRPPDDHYIYQLVGRVASEWAHLERFLDLIIWDLASVRPDRGACITAQMMGASARFNAIIALLTLRKNTGRPVDNLISKTNALMNKNYSVAESRNRVIHDPWYVDADTKQLAQQKSMPRKDLQYGIKDIDKKFLDSTLTEIKSLSAEIGKLRNSIMDELAASLEKPRLPLGVFPPE